MTFEIVKNNFERGLGLRRWWLSRFAVGSLRVSSIRRSPTKNSRSKKNDRETAG